MLSTVTIELPPLAKRRDDLPLLAQALLEDQNVRSGKQLAGFSSEALDRLCAYAWPGNMAELAEVVAESHSRASARLIAAGRPARPASPGRRGRRSPPPQGRADPT